MNRKKLLTLLGVICLALVLVVTILPGCAQGGAPAGETPTAQKPAQTVEW
jgi:hypothetical protein